jgi:hypothetical protein
MVKPRFRSSLVPAIGNASRLHTVFLFGTIAQEDWSVEATKEFFKQIFFMGLIRETNVTLCVPFRRALGYNLDDESRHTHRGEVQCPRSRKVMSCS